MGRPKKTAAAAPKPEEKPAAKASDVSPLISERKLKALLTQATNGDKDAKSITGTVREKIAYAIENDYLHAKAFSTVRAENRMSPEKLRAFYDHQEHYREVLGLFKRADSAPGLEFKQPGEGAGEEEMVTDDAAGPANDDRPFPRPMTVAAE